MIVFEEGGEVYVSENTRFVIADFLSSSGQTHQSEHPFSAVARCACGSTFQNFFFTRTRRTREDKCLRQKMKFIVISEINTDAAS